MTKVEIQVILVNLVLYLVGYVSSDITKLVLKVDAGSAVSFIDLWNMNGQSVGSESDIIFRHGVLDRPFTTNCPLKIYFMINAAYYIQFDQPFSDNTLSFLTAATPSYISQSTITGDVKIVLSPTGKFPFKMELNTDPTKLYAVIYHPSGNIFPKIYHVGSSTPVSATIPGDENQFTSSSVLQIKLRYADTCDISDPNSNPLTPSEAIAVLSAQPTTQEETTTTTTTTTTEEPTTTVTTTTTTEEPTTIVTTTNPLISYAVTTQSSEPMCPCDCEFKQRLDTLSTVSDIPIEELKVQLAPVIKQIKENLTVDASKLSSTIRKKQSATDERKSAEQMGVLGAVLLGFTFGMLILIDITSFPRHLMLAKRNCLGSY